MNQLYVLLSQAQYTLVNLTSTVLCISGEISPDVVKGKAVVVMRGDCDFSQKATIAQSLGATALLIASNTTLVRELDPPVFCCLRIYHKAICSDFSPMCFKYSPTPYTSNYLLFIVHTCLKPVIRHENPDITV